MSAATSYLYHSKFVNQAATNITPIELICLQCKTVYNTEALLDQDKSHSSGAATPISDELFKCIRSKKCGMCNDRFPLHERPPHNVTHNYTHSYIDPSHVKQLLEPMVKKFLVDARSAIMQDITDFYSARDEQLSNTPYQPLILDPSTSNNNGDSIPKPGYTGTLFH